MTLQKPITKKRGSKLGFWFFRTFLRFFGLPGAYALLYPVCLYYLIFDWAAVSMNSAYLKRRFKNHNVFQRMWYVFNLFINQGKNLIDRYCAASEHVEFSFELNGFDKIKNILGLSQKGFILLTAHIGNWQVAMLKLSKLDKTVHLLMRPEDNIAVKEELSIQSESSKIKIISPAEFLGGVIEITKAINQGDIVSIMGDRNYEHNLAEVSLFGEKAFLPLGAFSIAAAIQCPVAILLSTRVSPKKYILDISNVIEPHYKSKGRKHEELTGYIQEFAQILENYAEKYPFQWFVFQDLWSKQ
ncbi:MAG: hypothetical protein V1701_01055 [Planctomycetota bacterium]